MSQDSDDPELDKLLAELEKEGEEPKPIIEKQIKKNKEELNEFGEKYDVYQTVEGDPPEDEEANKELFW